jgi:hypothetical protein
MSSHRNSRVPCTAGPRLVIVDACPALKSSAQSNHLQTFYPLCTHCVAAAAGHTPVGRVSHYQCAPFYQHVPWCRL